jgi:hypothetical protein
MAALGTGTRLSRQLSAPPQVPGPGTLTHRQLLAPPQVLGPGTLTHRQKSSRAHVGRVGLPLDD